MISRLSCLARVYFMAGILLFSFGTPVTAQEWTTINKDYSSQRYVDLDQITPQNVGGLKESCEFQLNEASWFSSGLLLVDRTLYVNTMRATYAIDATTCALRWRTVLKFSLPANINNRGPAYWTERFFAARLTAVWSLSTPRQATFFGTSNTPTRRKASHLLQLR